MESRKGLHWDLHPDLSQQPKSIRLSRSSKPSAFDPHKPTFGVMLHTSLQLYIQTLLSDLRFTLKFALYRHSLLWPQFRLSVSLSLPLSSALSVYPASKAYISVTMDEILMKLSKTVTPAERSCDIHPNTAHFKFYTDQTSAPLFSGMTISFSDSSSCWLYNQTMFANSALIRSSWLSGRLQSCWE